MTASDLSSSLNDWIHFAEFGCLIVIIGIIGEGMDLLSKWWRQRKFRIGFGIRFEEINRGRANTLIKCARPRILEIETISLALVAIGLLIEVWASHEVYAISDLQNVKIKQEAGAAMASASHSESNSANVLLQVAELNKEAADARVIAGKANERAANTESNNLVLQKKLQPRDITIEQITNFIFLTEKISKIPIKICIGNADEETETYAYRIRCMFTSANFKTNNNSGLFGINRNENFRNVSPIGADSARNNSDVIFITSNPNFIGTRTNLFDSENTNGLARPVAMDSNNVEQIYFCLEIALGKIGINKNYVYLRDTNGYFVNKGEFAFYIWKK